MNQEKFNSLVRELVTAIGTAVGSFGLMNDNLLATISGFVVAAAMVGWAIYFHADKSILNTLVRKVLSSGAGVAVAYGLITPERAEALMGVVLVLISIYFGNTTSGPTNSNGRNGVANMLLLLLTASFMLALNSCEAMRGISFTPDGCVLTDFDSVDHGKYKAGICYEKEIGPDGKRDIDRYVVMWSDQGTGTEFKATRYIKDPGNIVVEYKSGGVWVSWDSKAGLVPVFPPEVENPPAEVAAAIQASN